MTPKEFMRQVIELYINARKPKHYHPNIKRGRSHTISGALEDLFAAFLAFNVTEHYNFYVDQAITVNKHTMYPDVMLVKNNMIRNLVDIKTDLGWKRHQFANLCKDSNAKIAKLGGKKGAIKDGITKKQESLSFSRKVCNHIVIISDQNIQAELFKKHMKAVEKLSHIDVYVLSKNQHPNAYDKNAEAILKEMDIQENEFERLMENLTRN